jgi:hypothetical protein
MNLTDELRKLATLHQEGHLTEAEFAEAKQRLITESGARPNIPAEEERVPVAAKVEIDEKKFRSSRWSSGNLFFPDALTLSSDGMLFRKGALFGSTEEHVNYGAVASFRIHNGIFLSNVSIETSGGSQPIFMNGLWKSAAREIQETIRVFQHKS